MMENICESTATDVAKTTTSTDGDLSSEQNTTAGVFASLALDQLNVQDVRVVLQTQNQIIKRLDQTNKNLAVTNQLSTETFNSFALKDFQSYILLLNKMNADLNYIFKHIKIVKSKLQAKYPSQYDKALKEHKCQDLDDEDDELEGDGEDATISASGDQKDHFNNEGQLKDRSLSCESAASSSSTSTLSSSKSLLVNLYETAKNRLSNIEFAANSLVANSSNNQSQPTSVVAPSESKSSPLTTSTATPNNTPLNNELDETSEAVDLLANATSVCATAETDSVEKNDNDESN